MSSRIHDEELDTSESVVRQLLAEFRPEFATKPLTHLGGTGTSNSLWRIHADPTGNPRVDAVVRLPRMPSAQGSIDTEIELIPALAASPIAAEFDVPALIHTGEPTSAFPLRWSILSWIDGADLWSEPLSTSTELAEDLASAVRTIRSGIDLPAPLRQAGHRGGPIEPILDRVDGWLDDSQWRADELMDVAAVRRQVAALGEIAGEPIPTTFVHGDLIPGNLLTHYGRLSAIIDWGGAGYGDPAQDLAPAWAVFDEPARSVFQREAGADDATWLRARLFELEHAVGGVLYYRPRNHPLGDVMEATLARLLADPV